MKRTWTIRAYENRDEHGILELWKAVYQEPSDVEQWIRGWHWKHRDNPAGASRIWLATDGSKLVGLYVLHIVRMKIGVDIIPGSQMVDLMTHPDYQRQGIFTTLARMALAEAGKEGIAITYGFPNEPAHPGHLKTGFFDLCLFQTMIKPFKTASILEKYIHNKFLARILGIAGNLAINLFYRTVKPPRVDGLTINQVSCFDERFDGFWEKFSKDYKIAVVRDQRYLNWRYVNKPNGSYTMLVAERGGEVRGYAVLTMGRQNGLQLGYIVDLVAPSSEEKVLHCLVSESLNYFKEKDVDLVMYQMIGNKVYRGTLRKSGFIFSKLISRRFPYIVCINSPGMKEILVRNPEHWFVQIGDSDWM